MPQGTRSAGSARQGGDAAFDSAPRRVSVVSAGRRGYKQGMRNRRTGSTPGIALALIAAGGTGIGCAPAAAPVGPAGSWGPTAIVEELAIGVDVGAPEYMFGAVRDIAVAPDGRIFAYQLTPRVIREYDGDGNHARDLGRQGQGPGEYQSPAIEVMPDGRLVAWDVFNNRLSFYERDGSYAHGLQIDASLGGSAALRLDTEGYVYIRDWERPDTPVTSEADIPIVLRRYTPGGELIESLPVPHPERDERQGMSFTLREGFSSFPVETLPAWSPLGYMVVGRNDRYEVELQRPEGSITIGRDLDAVPIAGEELEEWNAFRAYTLVLNANGDFEYAPLPSTKPFFKGLEVGLDGRIWVHRYVEAVKRDDVQQLPEIPGRPPNRPLLTWREPTTYDVFEPDGTFLGTVVLPDDITPHVFRGDHIWGVHLDADGVERVVRLRVEHE